MRSQCKRELTTCVDRLRAKTCVFGLKLHLSDVKFDVCVLYNKIFVYCIPTLCVLIPSPPEYCVPKGGGSNSYMSTYISVPMQWSMHYVHKSF